MRRLANLPLALPIIALAAGAATAQDGMPDPVHGTVSLSANFQPDPHAVQVTAGGNFDASELPVEGCVGFIETQPDYRVMYEAGSYPLVFGAVSESDTTLVINAPDGSWHCDDDSWDDGDPLVGFRKPQSGQYDIWVGSYDSSERPEAMLAVSESAELLN